MEDSGKSISSDDIESNKSRKEKPPKNRNDDICKEDSPAPRKRKDKENKEKDTMKGSKSISPRVKTTDTPKNEVNDEQDGPNTSPRRRPIDPNKIKKRQTPPRDSKKSSQKPKRRHDRGYFAILSDDLILFILSYLSGYHLIHLSLVSNFFWKFSKDEKLWEDLFYRKGWKLPPQKKTDNN